MSIKLDIEPIVKILSVDENSLPEGLRNKILNSSLETYYDTECGEHLYEIAEVMYQLKDITPEELKVIQEILVLVEQYEASYVRFVNV